MDDVAQLAGVSKSSVSRVLNGVPGTVTAATTARVHDAMAQLGYVPNAIAAGLKHRRTRTIGLVLPDLGNPFFARVVTGLEQTLQDAGYRLLLTSTGADQQREVEQTQLLMEHQVDAMVIATSALSGQHVRRVVERGVPVIFVDSCLGDPPLDCVLTDNAGGARAAARHLFGLGHREIAIVCGLAADSSTSERLEGAIAELEERGVHLPPEMVFHGDSAVQGGYEAALLAMQRPSRPTALFVMNNLMTVGALRAIAELGLRVPEHLALVAFDDMDWFPIADPPITAVAQPAVEIGVRAAERILGRLEGGHAAPAETIRLPSRLIVRGSTGPARRGS
jgi:LacI family transcriptional regulator